MIKKLPLCPHLNRYIWKEKTNLKCTAKPSCGYLIDPKKPTEEQKHAVARTVLG